MSKEQLISEIEDAVSSDALTSIYFLIEDLYDEDEVQSAIDDALHEDKFRGETCESVKDARFPLSQWGEL